MNMEIDPMGVVYTYDAPWVEMQRFGYPEWISDDFLLYSKAKLYRRNLLTNEFLQILPDSVDCFGYGISYSIAQQKIWFCNNYGTWSCNFGGGDVTLINPTPIKAMQLSNRGNYLMGYRIDRAQSLCLIDLDSGVMEEQSTSMNVIKAFYNEDLQLISYLCSQSEGGYSAQVRVRHRDGSNDRQVMSFGSYYTQNFQASADGRFIAGSISTGVSNTFPLYIHDLQSGETTNLANVRDFKMNPRDNTMIYLPTDNSFFKVSSYDFDTGLSTELHNGFYKAYRLHYLYKLLMRADGERFRIYSTGYREQYFGRM